MFPDFKLPHKKEVKDKLEENNRENQEQQLPSVCLTDGGKRLFYFSVLCRLSSFSCLCCSNFPLIAAVYFENHFLVCSWRHFSLTVRKKKLWSTAETFHANHFVLLLQQISEWIIQLKKHFHQNAKEDLWEIICGVHSFMWESNREMLVRMSLNTN